MTTLPKSPPWLLPATALIALLPAVAIVLILAFPAQVRGQYELWRGERSLASREYGAAFDHFSIAATLQPSDAVPHLRLAGLLSSLGNLPSAESEYRAALDLSPNNAIALRALADVALAAGRYKDAFDHFRTAIAATPDEPALRVGLAEAVAGIGDLAGASHEWRSALATPNLDPAFRQRAHFGIGLSVLQFDPLDAAAHLRIAQTTPSSAVHADSIANALALVDEIARPASLTDPVQAEASRSALIGYLFLRAGFHASALDQFERAVALQPDYPDALTYLGYLLWKQDSSEQALVHLHRAIALSPQAPLPRYFESLLLRSARLLPEAIAAMQAAVQLSPADPALHVELARTLVASGDYALAGEHFEQAVSLSAGDIATLLDAVSFYLDHLFRLDRGLALANVGVTIAPDSPLALDRLGWARHLTGDQSGSVSALARALVLDPASAPSTYHLAVVNESRGDIASARSLYLKVVELDLGPLRDRARQDLAALPAPD